MGTDNKLARHEVVITRDGAVAIRDVYHREVMHPVVGARAESEELYVKQSRLLERLVGNIGFNDPDQDDSTFVLFDVGLGAGSNALAARRSSESLRDTAARRLSLVSYENDLGALLLALTPEHADAFGLAGEPGEAARTLMELQEHHTQRTSWFLRQGDVLEQLHTETLRADCVYWDPFSPRANPALWSTAAFTLLRSRCAPGCTLYTYAAATSVRAALLLAGFAVGSGAGTGTTQETTVAALDARALARPLDARWLQRLERSSLPFPPDAPADALERIRAAPQFNA